MMLFIHLFVPVSVFSQDRQEISTDRPDQSTTPELVVKGALQIESGFLFSRTGDARSAEECTTYNSTMIKFGVDRGVEVRLSGAYSERRNGENAYVRGFDPFAAGVKMLLTKQNGFVPMTSVIMNLNLGMTQTRFGFKKPYSDIVVACSNVLGENASITYNFLVLEDPLSDKLRTRYTIAYEQSINERMAFFLESYGSFSLILKEHSFDGGFTYRFSSIIQFDISAGINPCYPAKNFFVGSGVSFRCFQ
jgi:hypothetical protein